MAKKKEEIEEVEQPEQEQYTEEPSLLKVYKKQNDQVTFICGVKVETDPDGREFFTLPASAQETVIGHPNLTWPEEQE
jgi:hypothetical protein